jgi:hypothetical protein
MGGYGLDSYGSEQRQLVGSCKYDKEHLGSM